MSTYIPSTVSNLKRKTKQNTEHTVTHNMACINEIMH